MTVSRSQPVPTPRGVNADAEPSAAFTPGQHLQAIHQAFFNGGGWADPLTWEDYDADGHAQWEAFAKNIATNIRCAVAGHELFEALGALLPTMRAQRASGMRWDPETVAAAEETYAKALGVSPAGPRSLGVSQDDQNPPIQATEED